MSIIDDEFDLMRLYKYAASQVEGITVFGFTDSKLALEHFKANQKDYKLVLSDYKIPDMDGIELLNEVKAIRPEVRTLLISAFDIEDKIIRDCISIDKRLQKPIAMNELIKEIEAQIRPGCNIN